MNLILFIDVSSTTPNQMKASSKVGKNATLLNSLDDSFEKGKDKVNLDALKELENKVRSIMVCRFA
ncbi:unnamed protein product [Lupinus luteus]|uniref:Uncharacterized protein n=1 Tax=Lupinus luteus TaxID=3873 RepID=A0AAV1YG12_LUPLU